jgi:hypothetical protein
MRAGRVAAAAAILICLVFQSEEGKSTSAAEIVRHDQFAPGVVMLGRVRENVSVFYGAYAKYCDFAVARQLGLLWREKVCAKKEWTTRRFGGSPNTGWYGWWRRAVLRGQPKTLVYWYHLPNTFIVDRLSSSDVFKHGVYIPPCESPIVVPDGGLRLVASQARHHLDFGKLPLASHFIELPLHYVQLPPKDTTRHNANYHKRQSEQTDPTRPPRHNNLGVACFFFAATATAVFVAFNTSRPND